MRILTLFSVLLFWSYAGIGQDLQITFSGTGESTKVDSVEVINYSTDERISLPGGETLILVPATGIDQLNISEGMGLFPNPFTNSSTITLDQSVPEEVQFTIRTLTGQVLLRTQVFLDKGQHSFDLTLNNGGIYLVDIRSESKHRCVKAICTNSSNSAISISELDNWTKSPAYNSGPIKTIKNDYNLGFTLGDTLMFTVYSDSFITVFTDSPTATIDHQVPFVTCRDRDNTNYKIVKIGNLYWMAENLRYLPEVDKQGEESLTDPRYYVYDYDGNKVSEAKATENYQTYGVLYNWEAAKKNCPSGWRLPTDMEWQSLEVLLGMSEDEADDYGWDRTSGSVGHKLKSRSGGWLYRGNGSDAYGFGAIAGGYRWEQRFSSIKFLSRLWTSTSYESATSYENYAYFRDISHEYRSIGRLILPYSWGLSVRCVRN